MSHVTVFAPATLSNLGPGFDCLGVAVTGAGDRVTVRKSDQPGVRVLSVSDPRVPLDPGRNTAAIAARSVLARAEQSKIGIDLSIEKGLPISGGLGGSAASAVAAALAVNVTLGSPLSRRELVLSALDAEAIVSGRHPDNVVPCVWGGAVLILGLDPLRLVSLRVHEKIRFVLVTPAYSVETARARSVLPEVIPRADAIAQAAHLGGLLLALERGDSKTLGASLEDRIAEPRRAPLYPGFGEARDRALEAGAIGVAVSGGGPTVLAVVTNESALIDRVARSMQEAYREEGFDSSVFVASVDPTGARVMP